MSRINPKSATTRFFVVLGTAFGLTGPFMDLKPVALMITTMALLAVVLPFTIIAVTVLLNQKHVGQYRNSWQLNLVCLAMIVFSTGMSYYGVIGLIETVKTMLCV